ncbi:hypothetical protein [Amycolatopsis sp. CA-126428]|uniref:hypothetical protein n=1 Tax=Amycolatopsis sp. CA-126428 TaxID=2073158 RepID=UPI000CD2C61E|nr:hypothetical protein [Amycolatopsis sp. CA-126428]
MTENSASGRFTGPVFQIGTVRGDVHVGGSAPVHSYYLSRVESFAPRRLVDRSEELAELARFCTDPATESTYAWWRAEAWSGKSALLAAFVLAPPPGVRLVAFFITGSQPDQSDRRAFVDNLLEQLCALRGTPLPPSTDATREAQWRGLLAETAGDCRRRGMQFALVVDGLDEDRGLDGSHDAHSIAALLPAQPPAGMRVIVSGRSSRPLPADVPDDHPLREPAIIRPLAPSAKARTVRGAKERDLKRLLRGSPAEQDVLGLLTAAAGGLTLPDLTALTGAMAYEVDDCLHTSTGRSFACRPPERGGLTDYVHVLAHEQLLLSAREMLGPRLAGYRQHLHDWADSYAARGWPPDTPDYLLRGYFALLRVEADLPRMLACATDPHRHRLALVRAGGDGAALGEITATQNLILASDRPDLVALARLAVHRVHLLRGNSRVPPAVPSAWAKLGRTDRAEAMLEAIRHPFDRIAALVALAAVCRADGHPRQVASLLDRAEEHAAALNQFFGAGPVLSLAVAAGRAGDHDRARRVAALVKDLAEHVEALALLAGDAAAEAPDRACALLAEAEKLFAGDARHGGAEALGAMAVASAELGRRDRAEELVEEVETTLSADRLAGRSTFPGPLAADIARTGDDERALRILDTVEQAENREEWLRAVIRITARRDRHRAEAIARMTSEPLLLSARLADLASSIGKNDWAATTRLAAEALDIAQKVPDPVWRGKALIAVAPAIAATGNPQLALTITREYAERGDDSDAVFAVAAALIRTGNAEEGAEVLQLTEHVARGLVGERDQRISVLWIMAMADHGDFDRAEHQTARMTDSRARAAAWAAITEGAVAAGELDRAEQALSRIADPALQLRPRLDVIRAALSAGLPERARAVARNAEDPRDRASAVLLVAQETRDGELLSEAGRLVGALAEADETMNGLLGMVAVTAGWGDRARTLALLGRLRGVAQAIEKDLDGDSKLLAGQVERVLKLCSTRIRSLTQVSRDASTWTSITEDRRYETATFVVPGRFPMIDTQGLSPVQALAKQLTEDDWAYVAEKLVDRCPDAYPAIIAELDKLVAG